MAIYITGSMAYDRVMNFQGKFCDYILPEKIHKLSVCFLIDEMQEKRGGTAGNIAYNLLLLGQKSTIVSSVGRDFGPYRDFLQKAGLSLDGITQHDEKYTASAYITTDINANQITGFHPAAMTCPTPYNFSNLDAAKDLAIIAPSNTNDMIEHAKTYASSGIKYIFDPGQQIPALTGGELITGISGAAMLVSNDYELELICKLTNKTLGELLELTPVIITTLGEEGSVIQCSGKDSISIPATPVDNVIDPTGAGDTYRAGLLYGLNKGFSLDDCARLASACASFCISKHGTQEHSFSSQEISEKLKSTYDIKLDLDF